MQHTTTRTGEPRLASIASWIVLTASFGLSFSTWVALGVLAGFTATAVIADVTIQLAWLLPVAVDGYVVVALVLWMAPVPPAVARFARTNTYAAALTGIAVQSAYHALMVWTGTSVIWRSVLAAVVGALPPAVAALAVHMRALIRRESSVAAPVAAPVPAAVPAPVAVPAPAPAAVVRVPAPVPAPAPAPHPVAPARPRGTYMQRLGAERSTPLADRVSVLSRAS
jgi:hypothetical protein